jgi:choline dehydrogenase
MPSTRGKRGAIGRLCRALSLATLLATPAFAAPAQNEPRQSADEYDYIVVGSGPGGGPLAVNLAKAGHSVLLLEAGDTSVGTGGDQYSSQITWDFFVKHYEEEERNKRNSHGVYRTVEGAYWVGRENPPAGAKWLGIYYPRGATVGGSSMINAMCVFLPPDSDWNHVAEITGDTSWK